MKREKERNKKGKKERNLAAFLSAELWSGAVYIFT